MQCTSFINGDLKTPGTYVLLMRLEDDSIINIGALGEQSFKQGWYAYVGSALGPGGMAARLRHHCSSVSRPRWHIDYLKTFARIREILVAAGQRRMECLWANKISDDPVCIRPVKGFGASDCRCYTHLFYFPHRPAIPVLETLNIKI